jgi:hypothetical protein
MIALRGMCSSYSVISKRETNIVSISLRSHLFKVQIRLMTYTVHIVSWLFANEIVVN